MHTAFPRYIEHQHVTIITHTRANQRLYFDIYLLVPHRTRGPQGTEDGHIKEFMETLTYHLQPTPTPKPKPKPRVLQKVLP